MTVHRLVGLTVGLVTAVTVTVTPSPADSEPVLVTDPSDHVTTASLPGRPAAAASAARNLTPLELAVTGPSESAWLLPISCTLLQCRIECAREGEWRAKARKRKRDREGKRDSGTQRDRGMEIGTLRLIGRAGERGVGTREALTI